MVMSPEHPFIDKYADKITNMDAILNYRTECAKKSEFERTQLVKDKTGVKIEGFEAINPISGKKIPVFIPKEDFDAALKQIMSLSKWWLQRFQLNWQPSDSKPLTQQETTQSAN